MLRTSSPSSSVQIDIAKPRRRYDTPCLSFVQTSLDVKRSRSLQWKRQDFNLFSTIFDKGENQTLGRVCPRKFISIELKGTQDEIQIWFLISWCPPIACSRAAADVRVNNRRS